MFSQVISGSVTHHRTIPIGNCSPFLHMARAVVSGAVEVATARESHISNQQMKTLQPVEEHRRSVLDRAVRLPSCYVLSPRPSGRVLFSRFPQNTNERSGTAGARKTCRFFSSYSPRSLSPLLPARRRSQSCLSAALWFQKSAISVAQLSVGDSQFFALQICNPFKLAGARTSQGSRRGVARTCAQGCTRRCSCDPQSALALCAHRCSATMVASSLKGINGQHLLSARSTRASASHFPQSWVEIEWLRRVNR
jgi:hypothetical protein